MINEAKYRSPKWLRNFIDYEVNTGDDISGEPSKREAEKIKKAEQDRLKRRASERAKAREESEKSSRDQKEKYDRWRKEEDRKQIEKELDDLYNSMIKDFQNNQYYDKYRSANNVFRYTFEQGAPFFGKIVIIEVQKITVSDGKQTHTYTISIARSNKFVNLANEIGRKGGPRPSSGRSGYDRYDAYGNSYRSSGDSRSSGNYRDYSGSTGSGSKSNSSSGPKKDNTSGHPKGGLYNTLKQTIKQREEQLAKMGKGTDRTALENELTAAKKKVEELRTKYKFENLKSFEEFNLLK